MRAPSPPHRNPGRRAPAAGILVLAILLLSPAAPFAQPPGAANPVEPERLVHLLQYIAVDYGSAVQDGEIVNPFEYREMEHFGRLLVDRLDDLEARGASDELRSGIRQLQERIRARRPWTEVRALASDLAGRLASELDLSALPTATPDVERGRRFYGRICATCHGENGRGDGRTAPGLNPPPTAFDGPRMDLVSPHQLHGSIRFGIEGTAMPAYEGHLDPARIWDIAFFLLTLRTGFAPRAPERELPLTLAALAHHSNQELLALARESDADVDPEHIDHYRQFPGSADASVRPPERVAEPARSAAATRPAPPAANDGLRVALQLQDAFAGVAEQAAPSVVGVTGFVRGAEGGRPEPAREGSWREGPPDERRYPGFRRARSGSGFLVSGDGYILTARHLLVDESGETVDLVDVERDDGRHQVARIVGSEATIDLGVLKLEEFRPTDLRKLRPVRIGSSDAIRVGHWAIALGNPAGPGTTFAVGTLSSRAERQCYQGELSATLMQASLGIPVGGYGGPLLNIEGAAVGMLIPGPGADRAAPVTPSPTVAFALPMDLAMAIYEPLKIKESRKSPWLGISVLELRAVREGRGRPTSGGVALPPGGVYIDDVFEPSPAAAADVRVGDSLLSIDGNRLFSVGDFQKWLYLSGIGRTIALEIYRDGKKLEKRITVEERPAAAVPR
jgi:S1-C subfamily serine protease/mono/diheme cytochrome c family protein